VRVTGIEGLVLDSRTGRKGVTDREFDHEFGQPVLVIVVFAVTALRVLREYRAACVFTLGRFTAVKGPGLTC